MCGGAAADRHSTMMRASVVGGDAGSNYYFRAAKHRVLGTLLGQSKLGIAFEVAGVAWGFGGGGGAAADRHSTMMRASEVEAMLVPTTTSEPPSIAYLGTLLG